jgi:protein-disulfide isomerase
MSPHLLRVTVAATSMLFMAQAYADTPTPPSKADFDIIIKEYIMKHPEVIQQSFAKMQKDAQDKHMAAMRKGAVKYKKELMGSVNNPAIGDPSTATVTITEFYDFHCGYCKQMVPTITKLMEEDKNIRVVFKDYPIFGPDSELAAKASIAFYQLNKARYFDFYQDMMKVTGKFDEKTIQDIAAKYGVNESALKDAMALPAVTKLLDANKELGKNLSVTGTPAFFVGTEVMGGATSYDGLKAAVKKMRDKKAS